jgi:hypothetical protein
VSFKAFDSCPWLDANDIRSGIVPVFMTPVNVKAQLGGTYFGNLTKLESYLRPVCSSKVLHFESCFKVSCFDRADNLQALLLQPSAILARLIYIQRFCQCCVLVRCLHFTLRSTFPCEANLLKREIFRLSYLSHSAFCETAVVGQ